MDWNIIISNRTPVKANDGRSCGYVVGEYKDNLLILDGRVMVVNGAAKKIPRGTTVAGLIFELGLGDRRVAVERNREVVPRDRHAYLRLEAGDRLELVTFVGGG